MDDHSIRLSPEDPVSSVVRIGQPRRDIAIFLLMTVALISIEMGTNLPPEYGGFLTIFGAFATVVAISRKRGESLFDLGLRRPDRPWLVPLYALMIIVSTYALAFGGQAVIARFIDPAVDLGKFAGLHGNLPMLLVSLVAVWVGAAFMEEIVYRGFLLGRLVAIAGPGKFALVVAVLVHSAIFGLLHAYQGVFGVLTVTLVAIVFGAAFLILRRNLWALIIAHGLIDSMNLFQFYLLGVPPA